jgi:hypothetical protein
MKKLFYFSILLISLIGLNSCSSEQESSLVMAPLIQAQDYAPASETQKENITALQTYLKTKDSAKNWSKDAILVNIFSNLDPGNWTIYYYSKNKGMLFTYSSVLDSYQEEKLNDPELPLFLKAPYREIKNWQVDSDKALALSGKESYLDMYMEDNQLTQKMEWHISFFSSVFVDIETGAVRNSR